MCRHIYDWNIVNCDVKQPISLISRTQIGLWMFWPLICRMFSKRYTRLPLSFCTYIWNSGDIKQVNLWNMITIASTRFIVTKKKRSDSVLWQKPLLQQKCQNGKVTTQTTPQKSSITQRFRADSGRSVGVTTVTKLVWLNRFTGAQPPN